jgi:antitoxin component of MazEF toxin-antitoxin module
VRKVGGSLGVFIPRDIAVLMGLKPGTLVDIAVTHSHDATRLVVSHAKAVPNNHR